MSNLFDSLDLALDEESLDYLRDNYPPIALNVERAVKAGAAPEQIRSRVLERLGAHRIELAQRCEAAARYLAKSGAPQ